MAVLLCRARGRRRRTDRLRVVPRRPDRAALNGGRTTLVGAGLVGAIIVVGGDYIAAYLVPDVNYPVGVVTGAFGAPFLLWLLATGRTSRRS